MGKEGLEDKIPEAGVRVRLAASGYRRGGNSSEGDVCGRSRSDRYEFNFKGDAVKAPVPAIRARQAEEGESFFASSRVCALA